MAKRSTANPKAPLSPAQRSRATTQLRREHRALTEQIERTGTVSRKEAENHIHRVRMLQKGR